MKPQDLYKLEPGHYFLRVNPVTPQCVVNGLMEALKSLAEIHIFITVVFAEEGSIEFIPKPKKKEK